MALKRGVLIIGSLRWDNDQRENWRKRRLDIDHAIVVNAPIRYGRRSGKRGCTFTMVFANSCYPDRVGTALLIPCQQQEDELRIEAEHLWAAERGKERKEGIMADWGTVGILPNPERSNDVLLKSTCKKWSVEYKQNAKKTNIKLTAAPDERPVLTEDGFLEIAWPQSVDGVPVDFDMLLATVTSPTLTPNYPTVNEITDAWVYSSDMAKRYERYFFKNVEYKIRTFDDDAIWQRILQLKPEWAKDYPAAANMLQKQQVCQTAIIASNSLR